MHVKLQLDAVLLPQDAPARPGFVFLRASNGDSPCVRYFEGQGYYVNRLSMQTWLRDSIKQVMPELQRIRCEQGRVYRLEYTAHGYAVAHTLVASERSDPRRKISFDFVPVFEFAASQWPRGMARPRYIDASGQWFAVPRRYHDKPELQDARSFIVCAPRWERLALHKRQNLKDSLRAMKALRNANEMPGLVSYHLKSVYLDELEHGQVNWNQAPGRILIRMLIQLLHCLRLNKLPFFLAPQHNNLDKLSAGARREYVRILNKNIDKLIRRRDADYLTHQDLYKFFGVRVED
ncbi:hypothetical protein KR222_010777 [Zaprionus bogoriensis]|nr:hypothetical protein KR222_010777 [Zaprionus bogoriensis]